MTTIWAKGATLFIVSIHINERPENINPQMLPFQLIYLLVFHFFTFRVYCFSLQLRYLQTLNGISAENNSTIVFPVPIDIMSSFLPPHSATTVQHSGTHYTGKKWAGGLLVLGSTPGTLAFSTIQPQRSSMFGQSAMGRNPTPLLVVDLLLWIQCITYPTYISINWSTTYQLPLASSLPLPPMSHLQFTLQHWHSCAAGAVQ